MPDALMEITQNVEQEKTLEWLAAWSGLSEHRKEGSFQKLVEER